MYTIEVEIIVSRKVDTYSHTEVAKVKRKRATITFDKVASVTTELAETSVETIISDMAEELTAAKKAARAEKLKSESTND